MKNARLYTPPPGFIDLPYTYAFDASNLVNGRNYQNQQVYIQGGYGDFAVRRVVGLKRILAGDGTGQFQLMRASQGVYQSSNPVQALNSPELAIVPEEWYPETGQIGFDLYGISLPAQPLTGQLAFQGIRRLPATARPSYRNDPKTFIYQTTATLTQIAPAAPVTTYTPINNYDFELYQIIILASSASGFPAIFTNEQGNTLKIVSVGGNSGKLIITCAPNPGIGGPFVPNQIFSLVVVGSTATINLATNSFGFISSVLTDIITAFNGDPVMSTLGFASSVGLGNLPDVPQQATWSGGGSFTPITSPICALSVYDHNFVTLSNMPVMDIFYDGGPGSLYENGAVVPPLFYRKDSQIQIDFYSEVTNPALLPVKVVVYLVGRKLYPCS